MDHLSMQRLDVISENTRNIMTGVRTTFEQRQQARPPVQDGSLPIVNGQFIRLQDAVASKRFTYYRHGLYKEADTSGDYGRIWVKREYLNPVTGEKEEWLAVYTTDEGEIIRQLATRKLHEQRLRKAASLQQRGAEKIPDAKNIPIAQGIKGKNITIDETGGGGTAKVTVEFTDVDQGLKFYQEGIGEAKGPKEEEKPEEKAPPEQGGQPAQAPPPPATPAQLVQPAQAGLKPTVQVFSKLGQVRATILKEILDGPDRVVRYSFVNEHGRQVILPWSKNLSPGDVFERPDTGTSARVGGYREIHFTGINDVVGELTALGVGKRPYFCDDCETGFTEGQMRFHKNHKYTKRDGQSSEVKSEEKEDDKKEEETEAEKKEGSLNELTIALLVRKGVTPPGWEEPVKEMKKEYGEDSAVPFQTAWKFYEEGRKPWHKKTSMDSLSLVAADISDEIPPMKWTTDQSQNPPANPGAGPSLPQNQNLQQDQAQDQNVLYDSNQDTGPQFQTTINPKDKSVTVKFVTSPQEEALQNAIGTPGTPPAAGAGAGQPPPAQGQTPPTNPTPTNQPANFSQQQVPVQF